MCTGSRGQIGADEEDPVWKREGMKVYCKGIVLPDGQVMREVDENGCKYLGVFTWRVWMKENGDYLRRAKLVERGESCMVGI